ncbi:MAG: lyase family protein [Fodinibius sp.]|nr:lyase family protein [Fodinibius sp.]
MSEYRIEKDSMGDVKVPKNAYYGAQTQRAVDNFPVSNIPFSRGFIEALGMVKKHAAKVNAELGELDEGITDAIEQAAQEVSDGKFDEDFPIDIFQTGSGTSTNMNANEIIAKRANELKADDVETEIHPNDHVNYGQSSNDVIPTSIRVAAVHAVQDNLIPALQQLQEAFEEKGDEFADVVKTGRTHLMDAMPVTIKQEFDGYARQLELGVDRLESALGANDGTSPRRHGCWNGTQYKSRLWIENGRSSLRRQPVLISVKPSIILKRRPLWMRP